MTGGGLSGLSGVAQQGDSRDQDPRFPVASLGPFTLLATEMGQGRSGAQADGFEKEGPCRPVGVSCFPYSQTFLIQEHI